MHFLKYLFSFRPLKFELKSHTTSVATVDFFSVHYFSNPNSAKIVHKSSKKKIIHTNQQIQ